jgi:hypothetical protein
MKYFFAIIILVLAFVPQISHADIGANLNNCISGQGGAQLCNPAPAADLAGVLNYVAKMFGVMVGLSTILYVVFGGFRMIMSQGNTEDIEAGKRSVQWALSGFVLCLLAYVIISAIAHYVKLNPNISETGPIQNPILDTDTFGALLTNMIKGFMGLAGLLAVLMILFSGFRYITAQGNDEQTAQAKTGLQWAVIGLAIAILGYVIVVATAKLFTTVTT